MSLPVFPQDQIPERGKTGFSAKWASFLSYFISFVPLWNAEVAGAKAELDQHVVDEIAKFDELDNEGVINTQINNRLKTIITRNLIEGRFGVEPYPASPQTAIAFNNDGVMFSSFNGSVLSDGGGFVHNNSTFGGAGAALPVPIAGILQSPELSGVADTYKKLGATWNCLKIQAGNGNSVTPQYNQSNEPCYLANFNSKVYPSEKLTWGFWLYAEGADAVYLRFGSTSKIHIPKDTAVFITEKLSDIYPQNVYPGIYLKPSVGIAYIGHQALFQGHVDLQPTLRPYI